MADKQQPTQEQTQEQQPTQPTQQQPTQQQPTTQQPTQQPTPTSSSSSTNSSDNEDDQCEPPQYPPCPQSTPHCKTEPVFVPINVEVCPIVNLKVNKPKICIQNKADCKPHFFLE